MKLFKTQTIKKQKIYIYVTNTGMFVAYSQEQMPVTNPNPNDIIDSADTYSQLMERVEKKVTRASRVKIAVPFSQFKIPAHEAGELVQPVFHDYIVTGQHQGTGNWLIYDVQQDKTRQEYIYSSSPAYPPSDEISKEEIKKYQRILQAQEKVSRLLAAWHERNRIPLLELATQQLRENTPPIQPTD